MTLAPPPAPANVALCPHHESAFEPPGRSGDHGGFVNHLEEYAAEQ